MKFSAHVLLDRLEQLKTVAEPPRRFLIALSGGLDSTVLAYALARNTERYGIPVIAVHVDHGLQAESSGWAQHCREFAADLGIDCIVRRASIDTSAGQGIEAAAREARYLSLRALMESGDWLLSAHHRDDQAETLLLNLMRSSGPTGLAGISACRRFAAGWLVRPLLDVPRAALESYARREGLQWIDDPSNRDTQFDRNYLRHRVLPLLEERWPDAAKRIQRSADLAGEASSLLGELAAFDRRVVGDRADRLKIEGLQSLSAERRRNLLRHVILDLGLPLPGSKRLQEILASLIDARDDAQPSVAWPGAVARRYRGNLYLLPDDGPKALDLAADEVTSRHMVVPGGLGVLVFDPDAPVGLSDAVFGTDLELRFRTGGEKIKPINQKVTKKLKKLLQETGIVPWMRDKLPLVYADDRLVAVADLWIADEAASRPGTAIRWENRPALH